MSQELVVKLVRSPIGAVPKHKRTLQALGLRKLNQTIVQKDTPSLRGMIKQVEHLLEWQKKN